MTAYRTSIAGLALVAGTLAVEAPPPASAQDAGEGSAMLVFDASGSMWGAMEDSTKIEIAKSTMDRVLGKLPAGLNLGLIAYGHREKGQCSDIETLVPPSPNAGALISRAVRGIQPKGRTPIADSVRLAARELRIEENKATVILVTDGIDEYCGTDPCALARDLEGQGIDFTAHVVGFGLNPAERAQIQCLADGTGGKYFDADDQAGLQAALADALVPLPPDDPPEPVEPSVPDRIYVRLHADAEMTKIINDFSGGYDGGYGYKGVNVYRAADYTDAEATPTALPRIDETDANAVRIPASAGGTGDLDTAATAVLRLNEGDYVAVATFRGPLGNSIDVPVGFTVEPGMEPVVDLVAGVAYVDPVMVAPDGSELSTGSSGWRHTDGEKYSVGYTVRHYYPIIGGERQDRSAIDEPLGPIPSGEYEVMLQAGGAVHRERVTLKPGDDYRPRVEIPMVLARLNVIDDRGRDVNDAYKTYVGSCPVQPRNADGRLTGCSGLGPTDADYSTSVDDVVILSAGRQVLVFVNDHRDVRAERIIDVPADATPETFTITMRAGQTADVGGASTAPARQSGGDEPAGSEIVGWEGDAEVHIRVVDGNGREIAGPYQMNVCEDRPRNAGGQLTGCNPPKRAGDTFSITPGTTVIIGAWNSQFGASNTVTLPQPRQSGVFDVTLWAGQLARKPGQPTPDPAEIVERDGASAGKGVDAPDIPAPVPTPPAPPDFGKLKTQAAPLLPERVFLRVFDGKADGVLLNGRQYQQSTGAGEYIGTWVYLAADLENPDGSTKPILAEGETVNEAIPAAFGGDGASDPAAFPTVATVGPMEEGEYVALSSFNTSDGRVNVLTPFVIAPGTAPIIDLALGGVPDALLEEPGPPDFGGTTTNAGVDPAPAPIPAVEAAPLPFDKLVEDEENGRRPVSLDPTSALNSMIEVDAMADVAVRVLGPDGSTIATPYSIVLCEDRPRDEEGRLQGCGDPVGGRESLTVPTGRTVVIGAWDSETFGASKVVTVPHDEAGGAHEIVLDSGERAREAQ